ncbi:acyl-CoA dehydrogenase family protein [Chitinophaga sp. HK235]|uniref:acyl-CoA dehydrogenase family protein n=1 Tax=Chitinophaga sp. HK235 TaxID=2952571 RepID=UPI001BADD645|nr:acyl-CoA dehydrogenase family protein [Chitinophaga sp. HK235]
MLADVTTYHDFETFLGSTSNKDGLFSFDSLLALDEKALYPEQQVEALNQWGLNRYFIPAAYGGKLTDLRDIYYYWFLLARRDLTTAIAYGGTFLGALSVWVAGSEALRHKVAADILCHKKIAFSLTERENGSDLLQTKVSADYDAEADAFELSGEKWLFNHASRSSFTSVLAKTSPDSGPRAYSMLYTPTLGEAADSVTVTGLDRIHTVGMRGLDLGGLVFNGHPVQGTSLVGKQGMGFELAVTSMQVSKLLLGGLALGSLDTLFRTAVDFCRQRMLYKNEIIHIPILRLKLTSILLDMLLAESFCLSGIRVAQVLPSQLSLLSVMVKAFVPSLVEKATGVLSGLLGARSFITSETDYRIFQKQARDNAIIPVFDGNTYVNYQLVIKQLEVVFALAETIRPPDPETLRRVYQLDVALPPVDFSRLSLLSKGKDDLAFGCLYLKEELSNGNMAEEEGTASIIEMLDMLILEMEKVRQWFLYEKGQSKTPYEMEAAVFHYAERYTLLRAAGAVACMIFYNRKEIHPLLKWPLLLKLSLKKVIAALGGKYFDMQKEEEDMLMAYILHCNSNGYTFSLFPVKIAM